MSDPYHGFQPSALSGEEKLKELKSEKPKCQDCGSDNDQDNLWVDQYCQECWEKHCSDEWWRILSLD